MLNPTERITLNQGEINLEAAVSEQFANFLIIGLKGTEREFRKVLHSYAKALQLGTQVQIKFAAMYLFLKKNGSEVKLPDNELFTPVKALCEQISDANIPTIESSAITISNSGAIATTFEERITAITTGLLNPENPNDITGAIAHLAHELMTQTDTTESMETMSKLVGDTGLTVGAFIAFFTNRNTIPGNLSDYIRVATDEGNGVTKVEGVNYRFANTAESIKSYREDREMRLDQAVAFGFNDMDQLQEALAVIEEMDEIPYTEIVEAITGQKITQAIIEEIQLDESELI